MELPTRQLGVFNRKVHTRTMWDEKQGIKAGAGGTRVMRGRPLSRDV